MYKILFATRGRGRVIDLIRDGVVSQLMRDFGRNFVFCEETGISQEVSFEQMIERYIIHEQVDLIICVGDKTSKIVFEITSRQRRRVPVVFTGVIDPVELGIISSFCSSHNHMTGVKMDTVADVIPAQLILRMQPNIAKILIPYRPDLQAGRIEHDAQCVKRYFEDRRVAVELFPITEQDINLVNLRQASDGAEAVVVLEGGLVVHEVNLIANLAKEIGIPFWGDGEEAAKRGAICAVKKDFRYMGVVVGEQAKKILLDGLHPSKVPTRIIPNSRRLEINDELAAKKGLILNDEIEISLDQSFDENEARATKKALFVCRELNSFTYSVMGECGLRMRADNDMVYYYNYLDFWVEDTPEHSKAMLDVQFGPRAKHCDIFIVFEDKIAFKIYRYFVAHKIRKPIIVITNEHDFLKQHWYRKASEQGIEVVRFFLPMPLLAEQANILQRCVPTIKTLHILLWARKHDDLTPSIQSRLATLQEACDRASIKLVPVYTRDRQWFVEVPKEIVPKDSSWVLCDDSIPHALINPFSELCEQQNAAVIAGNLGMARRFALSLGIDYRQLSKIIHPVFKHLAEKSLPPKYRRITLDVADLYRMSVNGKRCKDLGITNLPTVDDLVHPLVPVDHAIDTARCLGILRYPEHEELIKAKRARRARRFKEQTDTVE